MNKFYKEFYRGVDDGGGDLQIEDTTPITAPPVISQPEPVDMDALADKIAERMRPAPPVDSGPTDDPYERLNSLMFSDPPAYHREVTRLATQQAKQEIYHELTPALQSMRGTAYDRLTSGMDDSEKKYMDGIIAMGVTPEQLLSNKEFSTLAKDAAYGAKERATKTANRAERPGGGEFDSEEEEAKAILEKQYAGLGFKFDDFKKTVKR